MDLSLQSIKTNSWITVKKKHVCTSVSCKLDPTIQPCDTGQWIPYLTAVN